MKTLITGGTGFIGSRLALRCLERGDEVVVLGQENTPAEVMNKLLIEAQGAKCLLGGIGDENLLKEALSGVDLVFHLAAAQHEMNVPDSWFREINVEGTRKLLDEAIRQGVRRVVHGSTIGVYGHLSGVFSEDSPCSPDNIYGTTKLEGEKLALSYADRLPVAVARIPEVYGPGDRRLLKLFRMIIKNKFFIIGSGKNLHHLIYVEDLIEGLFLLSEAEEAVGQIFLFAGEKAISTREMADTVGNVLERKVPRIHAPLWPFLSAATVMEKILRPMGIQPPLHRRRMDFFRKNFSLSANKSKKLLAFTPKYSFEAGAFETARWYRENNLLEKSQSSEDHTLPENMVMDQDLTAQIEPFDTFWEAPTDVEKGFSKFAKFYKRNYLSFFPRDRSIRILVISCGAGYMVDLLKKEGYTDVHGIDSDPEKIEIARSHGLGCTTANAFPFLRQEKKPYGLIFAEQELNHLTKTEILTFLNLCHQNLTKKGRLIVHSLNGANPITGSEALSQNFDHYNTMTEYSIKQILCHAGFSSVQVFPLKLYIFFENPMNYIGLIADKIINIIFRVVFIFYGKSNKLFSKKIAAIAFK